MPPSSSSFSSSSAALVKEEEGLQSLPWEVLLLLSQHLDPRALALASCVCKSWSMSMSSDHLWKPHCLSHYPSLSSLRRFDPTISYRRLYALGYTASRRRHRGPTEPRLSLSDLLFILDVFHDGALVLSLAETGDRLDRQSGTFQFEVPVRGRAVEVPKSGGEGMTVAWTVVLRGWRGVFPMIDCKGSGKMIGGSERWFSEELPAPRCCTTVATSGMGLVAEVGLGFCAGAGEGKMRMEKVTMGLRSVLSWRYLSLDDGLRYLQHFLLPSKP